MWTLRFREMIRSVEPGVACLLRDACQALPARPVDPKLAFDHQSNVDHDEGVLQSVPQKAGDAVARQSLASTELPKLDQHRNPRHFPTQALDQLDRKSTRLN